VIWPRFKLGSNNKRDNIFMGSICVVKEGSALRGFKYYGLISTFIWSYGIALLCTASNSNFEILQRYQNKVLRATINAPWYKFNKVIPADLKVPTIREEITKFSVKYRDKIKTHPYELASTLLEEEPRRLKRFKPIDLTTKFS
jgi:hypothetical protein